MPDLPVCQGNVIIPKTNAAALATALTGNGIRIISGGTDTHLVLLDLSPQGLTGQDAETILDAVNITSNKNPGPFDHANPARWAGLRLGVSAATTRGLRQAEFERLGETIAGLLAAGGQATGELVIAAKKTVAELCNSHPIYR